MYDKILIKLLQKEKAYGQSKMFTEQKLICHLWNKYLSNKINQTEAAVRVSIFSLFIYIVIKPMLHISVKWILKQTYKNWQFLLVCLRIYAPKIPNKNERSVEL